MYEIKKYIKKKSYIWRDKIKKVIGKFKYETGDKVIKTFVGVHSKVYAIETDTPITLKLEGGKKLKWIPKMIVKKQMTLNNFRRC